MTPPRWQGQPWLEIIVPARNEAARLPTGLAELCAKAASLPAGVAIVVVDSASTDDTAAIVRRWPHGHVPVRLVTCARPGKGAAVRAGLLSTTAPYVGFCDADMATDLSVVDLILELLAAGRPMILGSRSHPGSDVEDRHSAIRRAGAAVFRAMARTVTPGVGDTQCGFKFFAGPLVRMAASSLRSTGFAFDIELIARCMQLGADPIEVPVRWRDVGGSTFSVRRHSIAAFAEVAAIWWTIKTPSAGWLGAARIAFVHPVLARRTPARLAPARSRQLRPALASPALASAEPADGLTQVQADDGREAAPAEAGRVAQFRLLANGAPLAPETGERAAAAG
jgi:dolichyl-phosphate beta-glucosyltransferase